MRISSEQVRAYYRIQQLQSIYMVDGIYSEASECKITYKDLNLFYPSGGIVNIEQPIETHRHIGNIEQAIEECLESADSGKAVYCLLSIEY